MMTALNNAELAGRMWDVMTREHIPQRNGQTKEKVIVGAMRSKMTDVEIRDAMKAVARATALGLSDERIDQDFASFKAHLAAIEAIRLAELPLEAEPASIVVLKPT